MDRNVLVADDDPHITRALALRLNRLGVSVFRSPDAMHALFGVERVRPDLVILDVNMPGGNGLAVAEMLAGHAELRNVPVIIHTGRDDELTRIRCTDRRHYYVKKSPGAWQQIRSIVNKELHLELPEEDSAAGPVFAVGGVAATPTGVAEIDEPVGDAEQAVEQAWAAASSVAAPSASVAPPAAGADVAARQPEPAPPESNYRHSKVLCIDDDPDIADILRIRLNPFNVEVLRALNGMQGFWTAVGERPDVVICDMCMADGDGNYTISRLKSHPLTENIPIIILSGQTSPIVRRTMLRQGVEAYLPKPLVFEELLRRLQAALNLPLGIDRRDPSRVFVS